MECAAHGHARGFAVATNGYLLFFFLDCVQHWNPWIHSLGEELIGMGARRWAGTGQRLVNASAEQSLTHHETFSHGYLVTYKSPQTPHNFGTSFLHFLCKRETCFRSSDVFNSEILTRHVHGALPERACDGLDAYLTVFCMNISSATAQGQAREWAMRYHAPPSVFSTKLGD